MKTRLTFGTTGRYVLAALGTIFVSILGSAIWDIVAKPGLSAAMSASIEILTLGSATVRDAPYASAPLDPTAIPSLIWLNVLLIVVPVPFIRMVWILFVRPYIHANEERKIQALTVKHGDKSQAIDARLAVVERRFQRVGMVGILYGIIIFWFVWVSFGVLNRAIVVRRIHDANIMILSPYLEPLESAKLQSRFASMTTEQEYLSLRAELERIAKSHGVKLRPESYP